MKTATPQRDPSTEISKATNIAANLSLQISGLEEQRRALLVGGSDQEIDRLDAEIARLRRSAGVHRERIEALRAVQREQAASDREAARTAALAKVAAKLKQREASAAVLERVVGEVVKAYAALVAGDAELRSVWQGLPMPSWWSTDQGVAGEVLYALHIGSRHTGAALFPAQAMKTMNTIFRIQDIAGAVAGQNAMLLAALRAVPLESAVADNLPDVVDVEGVAA